MGVRDEPGVRWPAVGGLLYGLVTAAATVTVLGSLDEYQVHDYADQDVSVGLAGALFAAVLAAALIAAAGWLAARSGGHRPQRHVVVPLVLVPAAVVPLVVGAERNRLEAELIWGAAAVAVHVLLAYADGRWRRWAAAGLVVSCAAAVALTVGCQGRWRAQKFEAVGLPLYLPQVPGYRLTGTWAGRYSVGMTLSGPPGRDLSAFIESARNDQDVDCGSPDGRPRLVTADGGGQYAEFCLRDGAVLRLRPGTGSSGVADLLPGVTLREVDGSVLADHPDDRWLSEPD